MAIESVRTIVRPDERVLWSGSPELRAYVFRGSWVTIPFSILWAAFVVFWEVSVIANGAPPLFVLWGVPFLLIGAYITVARFILARREAARTEYIVTDRRILIRTGAFSTRTIEMPLPNLPSTELDERRDGFGSISFGPTGPYRSFLGPGWPGARSLSPAFEAIPNVRRVFELINDARAQVLAPSAST